jgi:predicted kinase
MQTNKTGKVYIMRGTAGSGKSTWIKNYCPSVTKICSTDNFFISEEGKYEFDPGKLGENHNKCLKLYLEFLTLNEPYIVVDNTNSKIYEISPYYRLAEIFNYEVEIIWIISDPKICAEKNQHGVPTHTIEQMFSSMESLPPWWKRTVVIR